MPLLFHIYVAWTTHLILNFITRTAHHVARFNTNIHNILSVAPQLTISQKALVKLPEDGNVMLNHVGTTVHN
jgi:hypothetical protein